MRHDVDLSIATNAIHELVEPRCVFASAEPPVVFEAERVRSRLVAAELAQTFEHLALGNDCQLVDDAGKVTIDSQQCVESLKFYGDLVSKYSVSGGQDVDTTRASYFAGQAAMTIWSTFILALDWRLPWAWNTTSAVSIIVMYISGL